MAKGWKLSTRRLIEHFLAKVGGPTPTGCWEWQGFIDRGGYGRYKWVDRTNWIAHRLMFALAFGDFDWSLDVCHMCDYRKCVNPDHLFLGTAQDNIDDMVKKGRQRTARGEQNGMSKLTSETVQRIKEMRAAGMTQEEIGAYHGVRHSTVGRILRGSAWRHVNSKEEHKNIGEY